MFKSNGGFTLVELIVVIAILGLLAGIGIPAYSKYIAKATDGRDKFQSAVNEGVSDINKAVTDAGWDEEWVLETEVATPTTQPAG